MKRTALLLSLVASSLFANAQLSLTGTSYTQNFDGIGTGLPTGWSVYTGATASVAGTIGTYYSSVNSGIFADTISCGGPAVVVNDGFKNYPSANTVTKSATCAQQKTITDRALGVRQKSGTSPAYDPGSAFVLKIANTTGRINFGGSLKLQSLDTTSPRTTTWGMDYGIGTTPTAFTAIAPTGTLTTGGLSFANNTVNFSFGSALDNNSGNVWIRIVTLASSTGSGNRASTAIDDFNLTWTNTGVSVANVPSAPVTALTALGVATSDKAVFSIETEQAGTYNFTICDITGRNVYTQTIDAQTGGQVFTANTSNLATGMYIARVTGANASAVTKFSVK